MLTNEQAYRVLNRLTFGASAPDAAELRRVGLAKWLEVQLRPEREEDVEQRIRELRLRVSARYGAMRAIEERLVHAPEQSPEELRSLRAPGDQAFVRKQLVAATLVRAVHGRYQLNELMCLFWHDHFSVDGSRGKIALLLPAYDRDAIRPHALGNFGELLAAVAESPAMLTYLSNAASRAGRPNENYARELLELHTLGEQHYYNHLYDRWRDVPGAPQGRPVGYIDEDVYEVARAFTGWAVADGTRLSAKEVLPATGRFAYVDRWHDSYQKRVLAMELPPFQAPQEDGRQVLALLAAHPATAQHVCRKLCIRLVSDDPPTSLVRRAVTAWERYQCDPMQIARVIRAIVLAPEFLATMPSKARRPLELVTGIARAAGMKEFVPTSDLINVLDRSGHRLMAWPTPTGHPDQSDYWLSSDAMRHRWNLLLGLSENRWKCGAMRVVTTAKGETAETALVRWSHALLGEPISRELARSVLGAVRLAPDGAVQSESEHRRMRRAAAYLAMGPQFQER